MQAPKTDTPATQETPWDERHKQLEAEYREWEAGERKAGKLWRDIGPYTEWIYRRMDTAESTLAAERASRVQADTEQFNAGMEPIGNVRRSLFVDGESKWNGLVRDMTAYLEQPGELVNRAAVNEYLREWVAKYMDLTSCPLEIPFPSKPSVSPEQAEEK